MIESNYQYEWTGDGAVVITGCLGNPEEMIIPHKIGDAAVSRIGNEAFIKCRQLRRVVLPEGVVSIGRGAFMHCTQLREIHIPESVRHIAADAFEGCADAVIHTVAGSQAQTFALEHEFACVLPPSKRMPSGKQKPGKHGAARKREYEYVMDAIRAKSAIGENGTEEWRDGLKHTVPEREWEGDFLLRGRKLLAYKGKDERVCIPDIVSVIGRDVFSGMHFIREVVLPERLLGIADRAFKNCTGLEKIAFPSTLQTIGDQAFARCTALKSVSLPCSYVDVDAFAGCTALEEVIVCAQIRFGLHTFGSSAVRGAICKAGLP